MRIMLLTAGTRGDVEPFIALARAATARGHHVRTAIPDNSGVDTTGLDTVSLRIDFAELIRDQGVSPGLAARKFRAVIRPSFGRLLSTAVELITDFAPDVVVYHPKVLSAPIAAERLGIPSVLVETIPMLTATREFPAPFIPRNLGPLNKASYSMANVATLMFKKELAAAVRALPSAPRSVTPPRATLIPISPLLLHRPADWPASVHLTGHWTGRTASAEDTDQKLKNFVEGGDFVYAGFGSMKAGDASARGDAIVEAARRNGLRVLVASGWGGIDVPTEARSDGDLLVRESVEHQAVLPRAVAAIHHGGAGSVHAVVRAGIPSVVVPFIADQPFWGHLVHQRGLGPGPIPYWKLTVDRLTGALAQARKYRKQAARTGELMQKEEGTAVALDVLETLTGS